MGRRYEPQDALGKAIAQLRKERGLKQRELAARAGIDQASLSQIENGHWNPSLDNVARISDGLEVLLSELARRAEQIEAEPDDEEAGDEEAGDEEAGDED